MKSLTRLDLAHCEIGDQGIKEVVDALDGCSSNLEELDLSGNGIGRDITVSALFAKYLPTLIHYLS
jgi:hypothetical protein